MEVSLRPGGVGSSQDCCEQGQGQRHCSAHGNGARVAGEVRELVQNQAIRCYGKSLLYPDGTGKVGNNDNSR